jgi:hypothetical protein
VAHDGTLYAKGAQIDGSGTFTGTITANSLTLNTSLSLGTTFSVTKEGYLSATNASIGGWTITADGISNGYTKLGMDYNGTKKSGAFSGG